MSLSIPWGVLKRFLAVVTVVSLRHGCGVQSPINAHASILDYIIQLVELKDRPSELIACNAAKLRTRSRRRTLAIRPTLKLLFLKVLTDLSGVTRTKTLLFKVIKLERKGAS